MLSVQSQCLLRQKALFDEGQWLLVNPTDSLVFNELPDSVQGFHQYFDQFQVASKNQPDRHSFGAIYKDVRKFDGIVLYLPKAKKHTVWLLQHLSSLLNPDGYLCLVGENKGGIKSSGKLLEAVGRKANKIESARHCSVYGSTVSEPAKFNLSSQLAWFDISVNHLKLSLASVPGVFSHGELDAGTQLLLENVTSVPNGKILDFACGNGVIGAYLSALNSSQKNSIELSMCDVSALALYCAEQTMQKHRIKATIIASNGIREISDPNQNKEKFKAIYTNPPFHTGIANNYDITQRFIADAAARLVSGGELWLVANRFLPYAEHLQKHFGKFRRAAETSRFTLYHCVKT